MGSIWHPEAHSSCGRDTETCIHMHPEDPKSWTCCPLLFPTGLDSVAAERYTETGGSGLKGLSCSGQPQVWGKGKKRLCRAVAKFRNATGGAVGALAGPAWAGSSVHAHTRAGAQSCSHPFPWVGEYRFRNSHDCQ